MFLLLLQDHNRNVHTIQTSHATTITYMYIIITATLLTKRVPACKQALFVHTLSQIFKVMFAAGVVGSTSVLRGEEELVQDGQPCCCWTADTQRRAKLGSKVYTHKASSAKSSFLPSLWSKTSLHVIKGKHWPSYIIHDKQICVGQDIKRILVK